MQRIGEKGWNLYQVDAPALDHAILYDAIERGPSYQLEEGQQYILLPRVQDPRNPDQLINASNYVFQRGNLPFVQHNGEVVPIGSIGFHAGEVLVIGHDQRCTTLDEFYRGLDVFRPLHDPTPHVG